MFFLDWFNEGNLALQIFRIIAALGLLMAMIQIVLNLIGIGGDMEVDTGGGEEVGVISWTTLAGFALGFGTTGALMIGDGFGIPAAALGGLGAGFVIAAGFYFLMRGFYRLREDNTFRIESTVGKTATVYVRISAGEPGGQIQVVAQSRMITLLALSDCDIPTGGRVKVLEAIDNETVKVAPV